MPHSKSAIETKDDKRILLYGEQVLATNPDDLQILDRVIRTLLLKKIAPPPRRRSLSPSATSTISKSLGSNRLRAATAPPNGRKRSIRACARPVYEARATGNMGKLDEAIALRRKALGTYPSAGGAREWGRWLAAPARIWKPSSTSPTPSPLKTR